MSINHNSDILPFVFFEVPQYPVPPCLKISKLLLNFLEVVCMLVLVLINQLRQSILVALSMVVCIKLVVVKINSSISDLSSCKITIGCFLSVLSFWFVKVSSDP